MELCSSKVPVEIPFEEIASATDNFAYKNLIYKGSFVNVYKGKLLGSGPLGNIVLQWIIDPTNYQLREDKFWKDFFDTFSLDLHSKPSILGFCYHHHIIVYEHLGNGSLNKDVSDPTFSWMQRLQTCVQISQVIGPEEPISSWFSDTEFVKFNMVCLGDLMYEVLCERKSEEHPVRTHYKNGDLVKNVYPHLRLQMQHKSFIIFSKLADRCISTPCRLVSAQKDLTEAWKIQRDFESYLDRGKIKLKDIISSTNGFAKEYIIGSETYNTVYKAELVCFDRKSGSIKQDTVAIKCISKREDGQDDQEFFKELNMLVSCEHSNIVPFRGYCHEDSKRILVYKYAQSLDEYLRNTENKIILTWAQRIQICLDIAYGLNYLHDNEDDKSRIIHGNIKSANILLDENGNAMIADFGFSTYYHLNYKAITMNRKIIADTSEYLDPEYVRTGKPKFESDIYSFGVILFEILSGRLANDSLYLAENDKWLAPIARRRFREGTINEMVDPNIKKEANELNYILYCGAIHDSLNTFSKIAYQCLAETQVERPVVEAIIKELEKASNFKGIRDNFKIPLSTIRKSTNNFSQEHYIGSGTYGTVYKAKLDYFDRKTSAVRRDMVAIKQIRESSDGTGDQGYEKELSMFGGCEHPNIISLLGFCDESSMRILVYEYAFKESLSKHLESTDSKSILTWTERIQICLGIANGLNYLHSNAKGKPRIIHRDIKSDNILLDEKWNAKIADFGLSKFHPSSQESSVIMTNNIAGTSVYLDPEYKRTGQLRRESDIYSFGVVLFEVMCGRLAYDEIYLEENGNGIAPIVRQHYNDGTLKDMVDPRMKEDSHYGPNEDSLDIFSNIGYRCLAKSHVERPTIEDIIKELQRALDSQEMEHCSTRGQGSHSTGGQVSSFARGKHSSSGVKTGVQYVDCNEDAVTSTKAEFDDIPMGPETGHDVEGVEGVQGPMEIYKQTMLEKYSPGPSTHSPMDPQQWKHSVESQKMPNLAIQGSKFMQTGSSAGCSTGKLYDDQVLELQELRDKIEKMELYQTKLEAQLEAEQAKTEKVELDSKAQLEAERARTAELEEMIVDMKARQAERELIQFNC